MPPLTAPTKQQPPSRHDNYRTVTHARPLCRYTSGALMHMSDWFPSLLSAAERGFGGVGGAGPVSVFPPFEDGDGVGQLSLFVFVSLILLRAVGFSCDCVTRWTTGQPCPWGLLQLAMKSYTFRKRRALFLHPTVPVPFPFSLGSLLCPSFIHPPHHHPAPPFFCPCTDACSYPFR